MRGPYNGYRCPKTRTSNPSATQWYGQRRSWMWNSDRQHSTLTPPPLLPMATRLLRQVGQIFGHQFQIDPPVARLTDSKLRQKIAEKKLALGQKFSM